MWRWLFTTMNSVAVVFALGGASLLNAAESEPILLWPNGAPGAVGEEEVDQPAVKIYLPPEGKRNGTAVVICPGGGYGALAIDHEGHQVAEWFNSVGVTGIVLRYRLGPRYRHPAPLMDVQRAIRFTRANAEQFGVAVDRIGVMGFSAGGHLASTVSTHYDTGEPSAADPVERASCRPDFAILGYPVISFRSEFGHRGSLRNLLGDQPDEALVQSLSNETQVTEDTPPTFLFHTTEDKGVPVENSLVYYQALVKNKVPAELHCYQNGPHGVGLAPSDPVLSTWKERLHDWMKTNGLLAEMKRVAVTGKITLNGEPITRGVVTFTPVRDSEFEATQLPVAANSVARGEFSIPEFRGPVVGRCRIGIVSFGAGGAPGRLDSPVGVLAHETPDLIVDVTDESASYTFELTTTP